MIVEEDLLAELNRIAKKGLRGPARKTAAEAAFHIRTLRLSLEAQERSRIDLIAENRSLADVIERLRAILNLDPDTWTGPPWRPIATAPTNKHHFLVADYSEGDPPTCVELVTGPFLIDGRILNQNTGNYLTPGAVTHWLPLAPAPPEAK